MERRFDYDKSRLCESLIYGKRASEKEHEILGQSRICFLKINCFLYRLRVVFIRYSISRAIVSRHSRLINPAQLRYFSLPAGAHPCYDSELFHSIALFPVDPFPAELYSRAAFIKRSKLPSSFFSCGRRCSETVFMEVNSDDKSLFFRVNGSSNSEMWSVIGDNLFPLLVVHRNVRVRQTSEIREAVMVHR